MTRRRGVPLFAHINGRFGTDGHAKREEKAGRTQRTPQANRGQVDAERGDKNECGKYPSQHFVIDFEMLLLLGFHEFKLTG